MPLRLENTWTLAELLEVQAGVRGPAAFLRLGEEVLSYGDTHERVSALSAGLTDMGLSAGDRLAVMLPNHPALVEALFAAARLGALFVPIDPRCSREEVRSRLLRAEARAFVTFSEPESHAGRDHLREALEIRPKLPELEHLLGLGQAAEGGLSWEDLRRRGREQQRIRRGPEDPAALMHTLGRSGISRGAVLTHGALLRNAATLADRLQAGAEDVFLGCVPFSNTFGITATILACALAGGELVCLERYDPGEALDLIASRRVTVHHGVPTMFALELRHPRFDPYACATLRSGIMAGAPCPPELVARVREQMGFPVLLAYGLTEASPAVTITRADDGPITSTQTVGRPLDGVEVKVIGSQGKALPPGEQGELCVRGYNVMLGYWNDPEATAEVLDEDGWLHTGDLAEIDPNGPVRIVGRVHDVIRRAGFDIHPAAVETALRTHPGIREVAVVGVPDLVLGEMSCACVVPRPGAELDVQDLLRRAAQKLPEYAVPDRIVLFDRLPRSGGGAVDKAYLRTRVRIRGRAWKFGRNIDTDAIIPARHCNTADPNELAKHCMEDADPQFVKQMTRGDLIVAGPNFGCGSSREVAPLTIKAAGVSAVVAESFARIFFRNSINIGLPIFESPQAAQAIEELDEIEIEPAAGRIHNLTRRETYQAQPFPDFLQAIIERGGLIPYVEERMRQRETDPS